MGPCKSKYQAQSELRPLSLPKPNSIQKSRDHRLYGPMSHHLNWPQRAHCVRISIRECHPCHLNWTTVDCEAELPLPRT